MALDDFGQLLAVAVLIRRPQAVAPAFEQLSTTSVQALTLSRVTWPAVRVLARHLASLEVLESLGLDLSELDKEGGNAFAEVLAYSPPRLRRICCFLKGLHNDGAEVVAAALPRGLMDLTVEFRNCFKLGDKGIGEVVSALPPCLQRLSLDLTSCFALSEEGVAGVALGLPTDLVSLRLSVTGMNDEILEVLSESLPKTLKHIGLHLTGGSLQLRGVRAIGAALPTDLTSFCFTLASHGRFGDQCMKELAAALPKSLVALSIRLLECRVSNNAVELFASVLPRQLRRLQLHISSGHGDCDSQAATLVGALPDTIVRLSLQLFGLGEDGRAAIADAHAAATNRALCQSGICSRDCHCSYCHVCRDISVHEFTVIPHI